MTNEEIKFLKHCLQNYNYYWKHYMELLDIRDELSAERLALATNTTSVMKKPVKDQTPFDLYSSSKWKTVVAMQEDCEKEITFFWWAIQYTDRMLSNISDYEVQTMLKELYIQKIPRGEVRRNHFIADDKAMYRIIRGRLKKHKMCRPVKM